MTPEIILIDSPQQLTPLDRKVILSFYQRDLPACTGFTELVRNDGLFLLSVQHQVIRACTFDVAIDVLDDLVESLRTYIDAVEDGSILPDDQQTYDPSSSLNSNHVQ